MLLFTQKNLLNLDNLEVQNLSFSLGFRDREVCTFVNSLSVYEVELNCQIYLLFTILFFIKSLYEVYWHII